MLPAMCCDLPESSLAPAPVAAMLAEYRRLQATSILDWGHEVGDIPGAEYKPFLELSRLWTAVGQTGDWSEAIRRCVADPPPRGLCVARLHPDAVVVASGPLPLLVPGRSSEVGVLIDSRLEEEQQLRVGEKTVRVGPGEVLLVSVVVDHEMPVLQVGDHTVVVGEQGRYRVRRSGNRKVVAWAVGGGSVSQAPDPSNPDELLLIADRPGDLTIIVRVRDGMTERRGTKSIKAVPDMTPAPPFTLRLFLQGWGLVAVAVLIAGFAAALDALGNLTSADFIALVVPLAAILGVVAVARGMGDPPNRSGNGAAAPAAPAARPAEPPAPAKAHPAETPVHNQSVN